MIYFIDTNIFLRVLVKEEEKAFRECVQVLNLIKQNKIKASTSSLILSEVEWILEVFYHFEKQKVVDALKSILNLKGLKILDKFDPRITLEIFQEKNVKFIDALIASNPLIFKKAAKVISYDKDFDKLKIIRIEPKAIIS